MINYYRIKAFGVELEGGWIGLEPPRGAVQERSVHTNADWSCEVPSPPFSRLRELKEWFFRNYPDVVNSSCGMHVHVSFWSNVDYMLLMDKRFMDYLIGRLRIWGGVHKIRNNSFWERINGENRFCRLEWYPDEQVLCWEKTRPLRYTIVNFPYRMHGTVEIRVLPMFYQPRWGYRAISFVLHIVSNYLRYTRKCDKGRLEPVIVKFHE